MIPNKSVKLIAQWLILSSWENLPRAANRNRCREIHKQPGITWKRILWTQSSKWNRSINFYPWELRKHHARGKKKEYKSYRGWNIPKEQVPVNQLIKDHINSQNEAASNESMWVSTRSSAYIIHFSLVVLWDFGVCERVGLWPCIYS